MQQVFQSTFLQALGFAIANSLWQTALIWLIFMCVNSLVSFSASTKYRLAVIAQLTSFTWFIITLQFYYSQYSQAWQHSAASTGMQSIFPVNTDPSSKMINWMVKGEQFLPYVSMAYLFLMLLLSVRWFLGYRQTQQVRKNGLQKISAEWRLFVQKIATELGIKKEISLFLSNAVSTPLTIGFFKPIILIPIASINHLTTDQLEAVLLHEMAHIKRYDYLVNMILSVVEIALFFNPFTQLISRIIKKERENSCDDWVLQFQYNASVYAEALLRIAYLQSAPVFAMAASGKKNDLLVRVKRMIDRKENRFSYRKQLLAFLIVTGMLSSIAWLNPIASPHKNQGPFKETNRITTQTIQPFAVEPMTVHIDNPLFNPVFFLSRPLKAELKKNIVSAQNEIRALSVPDKKGYEELVESIPPIVANALEQAAATFTDKNLENEKAKMEIAKVALEKTFKNDSVFAYLPKKMRAAIASNFDVSMKKMNTDIKKAKAEMEAAFKVKMGAQVDQEKIQKDLKKALDELNKIDFENLISFAINMPGLVFREEAEQPQKSWSMSAPFPKGAGNTWIYKHKSEDENKVFRQQLEKTDPDFNFDMNEYNDLPALKVSPPPPSSEEIEKQKVRQAKIIRIKTWLLKEAAERSVKLIPVVFLTGKPDDPDKIIIQLQ